MGVQQLCNSRCHIRVKTIFQIFIYKLCMTHPSALYRYTVALPLIFFACLSVSGTGNSQLSLQRNAGRTGRRRRRRRASCYSPVRLLRRRTSSSSRLGRKCSSFLPDYMCSGSSWIRKSWLDQDLTLVFLLLTVNLFLNKELSPSSIREIHCCQVVKYLSF